MPRPRAATVLVVDDLESTRVMLRRQLVSLGHTVLEAADGAEALMPAMNGTEVAACITAEYPGLPVVLMSAYAPAGLTRVGFQDAIVPVLQKPFDVGQLAELIQVVVDLPPKRASP